MAWVAAQRGAEVTLIAGNTAGLPIPPGSMCCISPRRPSCTRR